MVGLEHTEVVKVRQDVHEAASIPIVGDAATVVDVTGRVSEALEAKETIREFLKQIFYGSVSSHSLFQVFGMTRPGIEPNLPASVARAQPTVLLSRSKTDIEVFI